MARLLLLLGVAVLISSVDAESDHATLRCQAGGKPEQLNSAPEVAMTIFTDLSFSCDGHVAKWAFHPSKTGTFFASVWRPDWKKSEWQLLGKNKITAETIDRYTEMEVPIAERIAVVGGDVIGIHYDNAADSCVISMESDIAGTSPTSGFTTSTELSEHITEEKFDMNLPIGSRIPFGVAQHHRTPAIQGIVLGTNTLLQLKDGVDHRRGRAEIYVSEKWGTVCDKWFETGGWPNLFCKELGYPEAENAEYVWAYGRHIVAPDNYTIHMQSPRCKPSDGKAMLTCPIHHNGACNHSKDVYVTCAPKIRLIENTTTITKDNKTKITGVPIIYVAGAWGSICETRSEIMKKNRRQRRQTWLQAVCHQLGYTRVDKVAWALDKIKGFKPEHPILMHNPTCNVDGGKAMPKLMDECPAGPADINCDQWKQVVITCIGKPGLRVSQVQEHAAQYLEAKEQRKQERHHG